MKHKLSILYSWMVRTITYFLPNHPIIMRFRGFLYSLMMDECGSNFQVASNVIFNSLAGMRVGDNVYIAPNNVFIGHVFIICDNVILGPNSVYSGGNHQFDGKSFRNMPSHSNGPVIINEGCWIAANCTVVSGAILPKYCILAAGAVLNKQLKDEYTIYGGMPAKKIGDIK